MHPTSELAAWMQAAGIAAAVVAAIAALYVSSQQPFDRDALAVEVQDLRSYASEGRALAREGADGTVADVVLREHASQLLKKVQGESSALSGRSAQPFLRQMHEQAIGLADALAKPLRALAEEGGDLRAREAELGASFTRLDALATQLKPGG